jgi:hypothetical protein
MMGSKVVEHWTHNPKIKDSNPAIGTGREKMRGSTVVEQLTHNP